VCALFSWWRYGGQPSSIIDWRVERLESVTSAALVPKVWKTLILLLYDTDISISFLNSLGRKHENTQNPSRIGHVRFVLFEFVNHSNDTTIRFTGLLAYSCALFCHRYSDDV
jgi:hypothetical protein